jgi:hypothetical protein
LVIGVEPIEFEVCGHPASILAHEREQFLKLGPLLDPECTVTEYFQVNGVPHLQVEAVH